MTTIATSSERLRVTSITRATDDDFGTPTLTISAQLSVPDGTDTGLTYRFRREGKIR